jgi:DNA gyrase subunit A
MQTITVLTDLKKSWHGHDGLYRLSETQAQEILQMRLQRLTGLEQDKIVAEYKEVMAEIEDLLDILAKPERVSTIISEELTHIQVPSSDSPKSVRAAARWNTAPFRT